MKKFIVLILAGLIIALTLCACNNGDEQATKLTEDFIAALEDNSIEDLKKCYNPDLDKNTDILNEFKENGKISLTQYDETSFVLEEVKKCKIFGKKGKIISDYTLNIGLKVKIDCTFEFDVVKVDGKWYLDSDPEINSPVKNKNSELSNTEIVELAINMCQADIAARNNEIYNNNTTYIDLDGVTQTVPDASDDNESKTISIYDAITPIISDGKMYEPYWKSSTDGGDICIYMNSDNDIISAYDDITINTNDTITPLTENAIPRNDVYVVDLCRY